jgi:hypothetical protein
MLLGLAAPSRPQVSKTTIIYNKIQTLTMIRQNPKVFLMRK